MSRYATAAAARDGSLGDPRDASRAARGKPSLVDEPLQARRLAYADPPYPGMSHYYRGHPDYAGEVDHAELLSRLATYDGWALSTSARTLPGVLALAVAQDLPVRVAAWIRGARPHATARHVLNAWEPVIYLPVVRAGQGDASRGSPSEPSRDAGAIAARRTDVLTHGVVPMSTLPSRVIGTKPAAFCAWMFALIGAGPHDTFDDLYPGSGIVGKTWSLFAHSVIASGHEKDPVSGSCESRPGLIR